MSKEIRNSIFNLSEGGSSGSSWTPQRILSTFGDKIALWTSKDDEKANYYVNKIGVQEREALTEGGVAGVIHPGRAISYDGAKSQYSRTNGNMPVNFRLNTNSITIFGRIKMSTKPAGASFAAGYGPSVTNGAYNIQVTSNGLFLISLRHSSGIAIYSNINICDGIEHTFFMLINKAGNFALYVDNVLQGLIDISAFTFNDLAEPFYLGGCSGYFSGIKYLRDIRIWSSAITSESDRDAIYNGDYVAGCTSWWMMEEGKESTIYPIKDSIGVNNLINYAFDGSSLVSGAWESLLNKFGYSLLPYHGGDLILGDGNFSDKTLWAYSAFGGRWTLDNLTATWNAADDLASFLNNNRTISFAANDILKISFNFTPVGSTGYIKFQTQGYGLLIDGNFPSGHTDLIFKSPYSGTAIWITATVAGGAWTLDNFTIEKYEAGIMSPYMDAAIPTKDLHGRNLTFFDQAKYNLQKVSESIISLSDYIGELFNATELIFINNWYDANGLGSEIALVDIGYQSLRQYYNLINEELIIIKSDVVLTEAEDTILKNFLKEQSETYTPIYNVDVALGTLDGTTAQIYAAIQAKINATSVSSVQAITPIDSDLNPAKKYLAMGWADFFTTDAAYTLPLIAKYNPLGFSNTFYRQIVPLSNDYLNNATYHDRSKLKMIEQCGSWRGDHGFSHDGLLTSLPMYDGRTIPSNDDLRVARADGTNELGYDINEVVDTSLTVLYRDSWLRLSANLGAKAWKNLSDADCLAFRQSVGFFGQPFDPQNTQFVLQALDYLSMRYCGTLGLSVFDNYTTRTPNTVDGLEPSENNKIIGGIFQGAATTLNHEIWERTYLIMQSYEREFEGNINPSYFWSTSIAIASILLFNIESLPTAYGRYNDKLHTKLATGATKYTSSITGLTRSLIEFFQNMGYICSMATGGDGYSDYACDELPRLECQRIYKKNGLKKPDNVGDGYLHSLRPWNPYLTLAEQNTLLGTADVVKELYDLCFPLAGTEYAPGMNFDHLLNTITRFNAWGTTPDCVDDSLTVGDGISSYILQFEALLQFCKRAGITVISHEQACLMGITKSLPAGYNYFPNNTLATTIKTITDAVNAPTYPDGWDGGVVISEDTGTGATNVLHKNTDGTIFTRQYAIKPSTLNLSFKAKGVGTLKIRKILNKDTFNTTSGAAFTEINSIAINSAGSYTPYIVVVSLPDAVMEIYGAPATPQEEAYQNYMKGYGDKICGIQIELVVTGGNYVKIGNCSLTE